jgi:hypothetical protein
VLAALLAWSGGSALSLGLFVAQGLLAALVIAIAGRGLWALLFVAPLDLASFRAALATAVERGQLGLGRALCEACLPALAARHALEGLSALERRSPLGPALDESRFVLEQVLEQGRGPLRALGRMATPLSFITIIVELGHAGSDRGLRALQRGLPLRMALDQALDALALGFATLLVAAAALAILRRAARDLQRALAVVGQVLNTASGAGVAGFTAPHTAV